MLVEDEEDEADVLKGASDAPPELDSGEVAVAGADTGDETEDEEVYEEGACAGAGVGELKKKKKKKK